MTAGEQQSSSDTCRQSRDWSVEQKERGGWGHVVKKLASEPRLTGILTLKG